MKIDCPHCGVHGSIDDSLAGKKLRCPKCSKVFLIAEELFPESDDAGLMRQEILHDDEPQGSVTGEEKDSAELQEVAEKDEGGDAEEDTAVAETAADDDLNQQVCSDCGQSFAPDFLEEVDSRLYCALCKPESEEEEIEPQKEEETVEIAEEEDLAEENPELETCSGCGESLHPEFLERVGSKHYCALCLPEDAGNEESDSESWAREADIDQDEEAAAAETDLVDTLLSEEGEIGGAEYLKEVCSVCGESFHPDFLQEVDSRLYCGVCQPEVIEVQSDAEGEGTGTAAEVMAAAETDVEEEEQRDVPDFTIGDVLKEAWQKTKGAKGATWAGMAVMYFVLFGLVFGAPFALQGLVVDSDPTVAIGINAGLQLVTTCLSVIFTAGIMLIGVRRAAEQRVSWKMVFAGFSKALSITMALILQSLLVLIGFCLLILPGIYLSVGYALTLPLILEKGLGPWQALEASRKAIHKKWWTVFGLYLVMGLIYLVSAIPLGLGLIWTVPMFFVGLGVLYRLFFGSAHLVEEEIIEEESAEAEQEAASE
ncbi:MAG: zinc-ribbon domain-containing protein [Proteobacteria bacterium]|nr:zinc-ribbon domain-containing protein [Pseudomonadota bacterium]MBU1454866.1 zinc-ribbon domain-containing protein [Pseudomonadota bacterium]